MTELPKLASPARRALAMLNIRYLEDLVTYYEAEIKDLHGIGPNALATLKASMKIKGFQFKNNKT